MKTLLVVVLVLVLPPLRAQTTVAGFTPGSFRVSESGAAEYRIPIRVPPGIAGMEPKLALRYSSHGGNSLVGMGWSLEGLSAVTRCPRTMAQDGSRGAIRYDSTDRFCLDGQRLIAVSGSYGASGTEYRTERESFSRIISWGAIGGDGGPSWFQVFTKSGQIMQYGFTPDAQIEAQASGKVRLWALNRIVDTKGNALTITYAENNADGEFYPARIDYAGNSVQFITEARPDASRSYQVNSVMRDTVRLQKVRTYAGTQLTKEYRLVYQQAPTTQRSRLVSVTECDAAGLCLTPTSVNWKGVASPSAWPWWGDPASLSPGQGYTDSNTYPLFTGDWNGDGRTDFGRVHGSGVAFYVSNANGSFTHYSNLPTFSPAQGYTDAETFPIVVGDWNADGRTDFGRVHGSGVSFYVNNGDGTWSGYAEVASMSPGQGYHSASTFPIVTGDWDGDGRTDIARVHGSGVVFYRALPGGGFVFHASLDAFSPGQGYTDSNTYPLFTGDWNGDGRTDIGRVHGDGVSFYVSTEAGGFQHAGGLSTFSPAQGYTNAETFPILVGDWNGDGLTDFGRVHGSGVSFYVNHGTAGSWSGFAGVPTFSPGQGYTDASTFPVLIGDWDGDGRTDFGRVHGSGVSLYRHDGNGGVSGLTEIPSMSPGHGYHNASTYPMITGDWNGDGRTEIARVHGSGIVFYADPTEPRDLIAQITDGLGSSVSLEHKALTDAAVYSKDSGASYPLAEVQGAMFVTASASQANGIGGSRLAHFAYGGLRSSLDGRGLLGFRWMESTDAATGLKVRTENRQDWPYAGMPSLVRKTQSSGAVLSLVTNTLSCTNPASGSACTIATGNRYFPFVSQSVESGNDLNGAALPTVTTTTQYDGFGSPTSIVMSTGDGYSKTTTNSFANDTVNWLLGRLTRSTVQSTSP